ncbi:hypothetical protein BCR37DRAFT_381477 [Protomyces lactucae-debilis]|uniref:SAP domain-containing protein n=1 Tax=Protomyces lactucae-debilis TaxID=2754530 RepID=A0A1Y2F9A8_PROLT|nr:uncharacterized protein BCR37DRAFT_381477 [Protomyces lactucae-debilis]ORY80024.1 hypothetical protein BCR37DRAFT_381477 [Protomyces lactucae-debilis]
MKNFALLSALAALSATSAFQWPTERIYNNWHETKLERWLKDHNIPYPAASDRKALSDTVEKHWDAITPPYEQWTESQLRAWLVESGSNAADLAANTKDDLVNLVTGSYADNSLANWILDSWTDSQLKSFLDYHNIPNPSPRNRDSLLQSARSAYSNMVSTGPSVYDSLFGTWTDSDLKAWCDARGIPVPQGSTKESMLAGMRKNTHTFTEQAKAWWRGESAFDAWSESQLKKMLDENNVKVPQGSKLNDLRALARKNYKSLKNSAGDYYNAGADNAKKQGNKAYDAAADKADDAAAAAKKHGNKAYNAAADKADEAAAEAKKQGNKAYNAAADKADEAAAEAKKQGNKAYNAAADKANDAAAEAKKQGNKAYNAAADKAASAADSAKDTAEGVAAKIKHGAEDAYDNIKAKVVGGAEEAGRSAESLKNKGTRAAADAADQATKSAGAAYAQVSEDVAGNDVFNFWSDSRLKAFLDSRGIPVPQNGKKDELIAAARKNAHAARTSAEDFEGWSTSQLQKFAKDAKIKLDKTAASSRDALIKQTQQGYDALAKKGDAAAKEAQRQYGNVQGYAFDSWSDSDLKAFLDSYGVPVPQGGKKDQLVAAARRNAHYFSHGQTEPVHGSAFAQMATDGLSALFDFVKRVGGVGAKKSAQLAGDAKQRAQEARAEL